MSLINITNLTFAYESSYDNIFENVSFQLDTSWRLGFIGRNGRGKTTFLNLLLGKLEYSGIISTNIEFEYFPYEVGNKSLNTIDIIYSIHPFVKQWMLERELSLLEVNSDVLYRPFETLSFGEQTKVLIALLFLKENSFLLIDEPTNHLDTRAREVLADYLKRKSGFILVSHDRRLLDGCVDHIISINKTDIEIQKGNFSSWWENKERQDNFELSENEKLKAEIKRLEKTAKEKAEWSDKAESRKIGFNPQKTEKSINRRSYEGAKSKKMMKRSKVIESRQKEAIDEKSKLLKNFENVDNLKLEYLTYHQNQLILLNDVEISYGSKQVCKDINFAIQKGDKISLCGINGSGKSSILKLICGENIDYTGTFYKGSNLIISYVPQGTAHLNGDLKDYAIENYIDESLFKAILRKLDFSRTQFEKNIADFSAGQKKKVLIAKSLCEKAHLYVWDEPLNYIDVFSRIQIEKLLMKFKPTIIFVEHDTIFSNKIASKVVIL